MPAGQIPVGSTSLNFHVVRGQYRYGLLVDTGAAMALMGTETGS